jgi:hypothetical protein
MVGALPANKTIGTFYLMTLTDTGQGHQWFKADNRTVFNADRDS